jgi:hypothetical protein
MLRLCRASALLITASILIACDDRGPRSSASTKPDGRTSTANANSDPVPVAKAAAERLHAACDEWAAARAAGGPIQHARREVRRAQSDLHQALGRTNYDVNNVSLWTREQAAAGSYRAPDGVTSSYIVGTGQSGLIVAGWRRAEWTRDQYPGQGIAFSIGLEPYELQEDFHVGLGRWDEKGQVLRVPYLLVDVPGTFELHLKDGKWSFHPDRGEMNGNWWRPFKQGAATRPAE